MWSKKNLKEIYEIFYNFAFANCLYLISKSNDYFKALELFNLRKIEESVDFFKKVANDEQNEKRSDAMFNLAVIYDNGFGIAQDKTRALYYYELAADLSNIYAQYNLGWKYYNGENVYKDVNKAFNIHVGIEIWASTSYI